MILIVTGVVAIAAVAAHLAELRTDLRQIIGVMTATESGGLDAAEAEAWNSRAHDQLQAMNCKSALTFFEAATQCGVQRAEYYQDLANCMLIYRRDASEVFHLTENQVFDRVETLFKFAIQLNPDDFELSCDFASSFYMMHPARWVHARHAWEIAGKSAKSVLNHEFVNLNLARLDIKQGKFDDASARLQLVKSAKNQDAHDMLFQMLVRERSKWKARAGNSNT
ncbi:MAG: hypothetical protein WCS99_03535 [Limisphaerales bacterium]